MSAFRYVFPEENKQAFNCSHCGAFAQQEWYLLAAKKQRQIKDETYHILTNPLEKNCPHSQISGITGSITCSKCAVCGFIALWINHHLIFPSFPLDIPKPHEDMPDKIKEIYNEAAEISNKSPKSAAALLRLCVDSLANDLKLNGEDLCEKINNSQWPEEIKKACHVVRLCGNKAIHPGKIEIADDTTVMTLFEIINFLIEKEIHIPKRINEINEKVSNKNKEQKHR